MRKLILSSVLSVSILANNNYNIILDPHLSPYIGADDLIVAHRLLENTPLSQYGKPLLSQNNAWSMLGRFSEMFLVWNPINYTTMVTQHEVFGHGYRVRSMRDTGAEVTHYKIGVPPPYGPGGGYTEYRWVPSGTSVFQLSNINTAGVEATAILANRLRMQWVSEQKILPAQASLYFYTQHDLSHYVLVTKKDDSGDIAEYIALMNQIYGGNRLSHKALKHQVYANLLDPFTYYALYSQWRYISQGKDTSIPMIPIGSYKYLPSFRLGLSPFGTEYYLENFLVKDYSPLYLYLRGGSFAGHHYSGVGIEYPDLWKIHSWSFGVRSDVWLQPNVDFGDSQYNSQQLLDNEWRSIKLKGSRLGSSCSVICQKEVWENGAFFMQLGGKTKGYLPGENLDGGMIFRVGLTLW